MAGWFPLAVAAAAGQQWQTLSLGGGGYVTGLSMNADGTKYVRTDTYNGYCLESGSSVWRPLLKTTNMPAGKYTTETLNNNGGGLYEVCCAPSNSSRVYAYFNGEIYRSDDKGLTWSITGFSSIAASSNASNRTMGRFMAVHPTDPDTVLVGTPSGKPWYSTNGGTSWTQLTSLAAPTSSGNSLFAFDQSTPTTVYISVYGTGVYRSTTGVAGTFSLLSGTPTTHNTMTVASDGSLWVVDAGSGANGTIRKFASGSWTTKSPGASSGDGTPTANNIHTIAINPADPSKIVVGSAGSYIGYSTDGLSTVQSLCFDTTISGDQTWNAKSHASNPGLSIADIKYDPAGTGRVWATVGFGVLHSDPAAGVGSNAVTWTSICKGIEQTVGVTVMWVPGSATVLCGSEDFPLARKTSANFGTPLDAIRPSYLPADTLAIGSSFDYAPSTPATVFGLMSGGLIESFGQDFSGFSTDSGATWTQWTSIPTTISNGGGGNIAAASTTNVVLLYQGTGAPYYTTNANVAAPTWTASTGVSDVVPLSTVISTYLAADKQSPGTFYIYKSQDGTYKSTNNGASFSKVSSVLDSAHDGFSICFKCNPSVAGDLWYTSGWQAGSSHPVSSMSLYRSTNSGTSYSAVSGFSECFCLGFGAVVSGQSYCEIYVVGYRSTTFGIWKSTDNGSTWTSIGDFPEGNPQYLRSIDGDKTTPGRVAVAIDGSSFKYYG